MDRIAGYALALLMLLAAAAMPAAAQSVSPKPRSSGASGLEVRSDIAVSGGMLYGDGGTVSARPAAASPGSSQPQAEGAAAAPHDDGAVRINGNATSNATGSDLNANTVGQHNSGCNNVGSISGRGC